MKKLKLKKSKAFTLVELLLVVGIIALGSIVAYITLPKVQSSMRANKEITNIRTLVAGAQNMYAGKAYTGLSMEILNKTKATPDNWRVASDPTIALNSFGGEISIQGIIFQNKPAIFVNFFSVPNDECVKISNSLQRDSLALQIVSLSTNIVVKDISNVALNRDADPGVVVDACAAPGNSNRLEFIFR